MMERTKPKITRSIAFLLVACAVALVFVSYLYFNSIYPDSVDTDTFGHLFKINYLHHSLREGVLYPIYTEYWYNSMELFRYWPPLAYYVVALLQFCTQGDVLNAFYLFAGVAYLLNMIGWFLLGKTENMFLKYAYEIKPFLHSGANQLRVEMKSTIKAIEDGEKADDYISIFNKERFFVRKAQCHFGWDWAPNMCGYGIWRKVYLNIGSKYRIKDTHYRTDLQGNVTIFAEMNYNLMNVYAPGSVVAVAGAEIPCPQPFL